ncbi:MAG: hypothetical protein ACRYHQ_23375 [Janthinobacterium lividum]
MDTALKGGHSLLAAFRNLLSDSFSLRVAEVTMRAKSAQGPMEAAEVVRLRGILWAALSDRLRTSALVATGFIHGATVPEQIHPAFFNNAVPEYDRDEVSMNGATYAGVRVFPTDTMPATQHVVSSETAPEPRNTGGAPPRYDWDAFIVEIVRLAFNGAFLDRAELRGHMRKWCTREWGHLTQIPDDKTIKRRVDLYCHPDIPENADK